VPIGTVPHAPVLVVPTNRDDLREPVAKVRGALGALSFPDAPAVVVVSPHGRRAGVYRPGRASLDAFGVRGIETDVGVDDGLSKEIAAAWGVPVLDDAIDHGVAVPLMAGWRPRAPLVAVTLTEITGPAGAPLEQALFEAMRLERALADVLPPGSAVIGSAHGSATLGPGAPVPHVPEGEEFDAILLERMNGPAGGLASVPPRYWEASASCGAGPLTLLGMIAPSAQLDVKAWEAPAGVRWIVARD
jgi:hypothetical protein